MLRISEYVVFLDGLQEGDGTYARTGKDCKLVAANWVSAARSPLGSIILLKQDFGGLCLKVLLETEVAMVHVWPNDRSPPGVFENYDTTLAYQRLGSPQRYWTDADVTAAQGLALDHEEGCDNELDAKLRLADVSFAARPNRIRLSNTMAWA